MQTYLEWRENLIARDKRDHQRAEIEMPVVVHADASYQGLALNISAGGIFVALAESLEDASVVELEFEMPGTGQRLRVLGKVRWRRLAAEADEDQFPGLGIEFLNLGAEGLAHLEKFVDSVCDTA